MSLVAQLHHAAMDLCDKALAAQSSGNIIESRELFRQAFEHEQKAAEIVAGDLKLEPTRSVLHRSAASLAIDCGEYRWAEKLIATALSGDPPEEIADELRDLLEQVSFDRHLDLRGMKLSKDEFQLSISGKATSFGMAQSDAFVDRVRAAEKLLFRTIERKMGRPFHETGKAIKEVSKNYELYLSAPRAASFAVTLKIGVPQKQLALPTLEEEIIDKTDAVIDDLLTCLESFGAGDEENIEKLIPDESYRRNFVALAEQLAPDGEQVKVVGLTVLRQGIERKVALKWTERRRTVPSRAESIRVSGTLLFANSLRAETDTIRIVDDNGQAHSFVVPKGMMSDIVKPLWDERVVVTGVRRRGKYVLDRIAKAMETESSPTT